MGWTGRRSWWFGQEKEKKEGGHTLKLLLGNLGLAARAVQVVTHTGGSSTADYERSAGARHC